MIPLMVLSVFAIIALIISLRIEIKDIPPTAEWLAEQDKLCAQAIQAAKNNGQTELGRSGARACSARLLWP